MIVESVARGDKVSLVGFGTFDSKERAARDGRNPKTGETVPIAGVCIRELLSGQLLSGELLSGELFIEICFEIFIRWR